MQTPFIIEDHNIKFFQMEESLFSWESVLLLLLLLLLLLFFSLKDRIIFLSFEQVFNIEDALKKGKC